MADPDTLTTLTNLLAKPGWLRLPLLLTVRDADAEPTRELLTALRAAAGPEALLEIAPQPDAVKPFDWRCLPADVFWVLRAGALIGAEFDAALVARLLDADTAVILRRLQTAADAGAPLTDLGDGRFSLGPATAELRAGLLSSVAGFWHRRLGALLADRNAAPPADTAARPEPPAQSAPPSVAELLQADPPAQPVRPRQPPAQPALAARAETPPTERRPAGFRANGRSPRSGAGRRTPARGRRNRCGGPTVPRRRPTVDRTRQHPARAAGHPTGAAAAR